MTTTTLSYCWELAISTGGKSPSLSTNKQRPGAVVRENDNTGGSPEQLNEKQFLAFARFWDFLQRAATEPQLDMVEPFLLHGSWAAGTGKAFGYTP